MARAFHKCYPDAKEDFFGKCTHKIGTAGWGSFKFLFFGPDGNLYAVNTDGSFLKGPPPVYAYDNWRARATVVGTTGWADFQFLFFGPDRNLYAVRADGSGFFKGPPPTHSHDNCFS